jgi:DNA helicase-2/ATP-dependent DNA helicase PcrA
VRGGAFLERPAAKRLLRVLRDGGAVGVGALVRAAALADGLLEEPGEGLGEQEETRQADLARLVRLAELFDPDGSATAGEFLADLDGRFRSDGDGRGVQLLTYHRSKGLEFEAVVLPRLEEGDLPVRQAKEDLQVDEERRLLYVGITRAKAHLVLTWAGKRSRFLTELGLGAATPVRAAGTGASRERDDAGKEALDTPLGTALRTWRLARAREDNVPAYVVFSDRTLAELAERRPASLVALSGITGIGPAKLERYGSELLDVLGGRIGASA